MKLGLPALIILALLSFSCSNTNPAGPSTPPDAAADRSADVVVPDMADHGGHYLSATLTGAPPALDTDGSGTLTMSANRGQAELCYGLYVHDTAAPTGVDMHQGPAGSAGIWIRDFMPLADGYGGYFVRACEEDLDRNMLQALVATPESFYVEVHTTEFGDGAAIRGQLTRPRGNPYGR